MSTKRNRDGSPKPSSPTRDDPRMVEIESPVSNHRRVNSDVTDGKMLTNSNLAYLDEQNAEMDMSPLKRLQRLKQNGSLRLAPGRGSRRKINFPADIQNHSGSESSLAASSDNGSRSDISTGNSPCPERQQKSCVKLPNMKDLKDCKSVHFEDEYHDSNGNTTNSVVISKENKEIRDSNGNLGDHGDTVVLSKDDGKFPELTEDTYSNMYGFKTQYVPRTPSSEVSRNSVSSEEQELMSSPGSESALSNDVDSETGEVKVATEIKSDIADVIDANVPIRTKPAIPAKPMVLKNLEQCVQSNSSPIESHKTVISAQSSSGDQNNQSTKKDKKNIVTVQYSAVPKPVIDVRLVQRDTKSQTPSPSLKHVLKHDDKWLSKSVDELDKPEDLYSSPSTFVRDTKLSARHSFMEKDRHSFLDKERESIYKSIGDVQTLLRNSLMEEEEKIYSLPQPACYGDNTLKAVKKITEKYDTLQRRKLRALSFREDAKYTGNGTSFSQPSSPISPTGLGGVMPPPTPSSPPPPLSAATTVSSAESSVFDIPDSIISMVEGIRTPPPPPPRRTSPTPSTLQVEASKEVVSITNGISERDAARIDLFYHGRDTEVYVCQCLADITFGSAMCSGSEEVSDWGPVVNTGVPLFIFNTGKGKRKRDLLLTLAERETGFPLWSDKINYLSNYRETDPKNHVLQLSNNLRKVTGLNFYCAKAAKAFIEQFREITKNPHDDLWKVSTCVVEKKKKRSFSFKRSKPKKTSKKEISVPCNFSHITSIDPQDRIIFDNLREISSTSRSLPTSPTHSRPASIANSHHC